MTATQNYQVLPSPRPTTICINPPKPKRTWQTCMLINMFRCWQLRVGYMKCLTCHWIILLVVLGEPLIRSIY